MHPYLSRQIKKFLPEELQNDSRLKQFLDAVSSSYMNYDRDRELSEHAFFINEQEYEQINQRLRNLTNELEAKVIERTRELEFIARFPRENPNPIFRISAKGEVLYKNPPAEHLIRIHYQNNLFSSEDFFYKLIPTLKNSGSLELDSGDQNYLFYYIKSPTEGDYNLFGTNITERNILRKRAYDNFYRLSNFLESTDDAYYVIYTKFSEKNFVTSKWANFYGFNASHANDIIKKRANSIRKDFLPLYKKTFANLSLGDKIMISYCAVNKSTREEFWLEEIVSKQYDPMTGDIIITGRITDKTKQHLFSEQVKESEERFKLLMDNLPVMIWVSDENNIVNYSNKAADELLGKPMQSLNGQGEFSKFIHPDDQAEAVKKWNKQLKKKDTSITEFRFKAADGQYKNLYQKAVPRMFQDGSHAGYIGAIFDLTNEKQIQQSLVEEKEKLDLVTKNSPDIIVLTDNQGVIEYVSPSAERILGFKVSELTGQNFLKFVKGNAREKNEFRAYFKKDSVQGGGLPSIKLQNQNGETVWCETAITVIPAGRSKKILFYNRDITSEKNAQDALIQSENKYKSLFESMKLGVMEVDNEDNILWANRSFEKMSGYKLSELTGKKALTLFLRSQEDKKKMIKINSSRRNKNVSMYEIPFKTKSGKMLEMVISGSPIIDKNGKVRGSVGIHWDVTPFRDMQRKLEAERMTREHDILQASLDAEEQQKEILGRELHDGVGQMLTYTSLYLQMASESKDSPSKMFLTARERILSTLNEVRRISRSLVPGVLNDLGLKEAIFELGAQAQEMTGIHFKFICPGADINGIDFNVKTSLYRVVQEMTNNTLKYAKAQNITLKIGLTTKGLTMKYKDDGIGFEMEKLKLGVGLKSIQTRIGVLGGVVKIKSGLNQGVEYIIQIPLSKVIRRK